MPKITDVEVQILKAVCDCGIEKGEMLDSALKKICKSIKSIRQALSLSGVPTGLLNIGCELTEENLLSEILTILIKKSISLEGSIDSILQSISNINLNLQNATDKYVAVTQADANPGFLKDKISSEQYGALKIENGQIIIRGLVPVGTVVMINRSRLVDFTITGLGKPNTDVYGWAISNGANGTVNRLGKMPKYATDLTQAGNSAGSDTVSISPSNIPSITLPVSGTISDGLTSDVQIEIDLNANRIKDGSGGNTDLLRFTQYPALGPYKIKSIPISLKHSHNHSLSAKWQNNSQTALNILPAHILEIPIEKINL